MTLVASGAETLQQISGSTLIPYISHPSFNRVLVCFSFALPLYTPSSASGQACGAAARVWRQHLFNHSNAMTCHSCGSAPSLRRTAVKFEDVDSCGRSGLLASIAPRQCVAPPPTTADGRSRLLHIFQRGGLRSIHEF